ncbi:MCE family protein [Pseudonocardia sp. KRD-184]|uniref:MCE family protein n=1 Tax=Pseudonocardia oceani TaxID=2792013 RepID=A0ABS6U2R5_9PSEU|nr:MlaD family protein [Pseudonocardia oceani]MBW0089263.1 MCE family protein [Pseudonocardia oceani]MBW0094982.1 MCE family protein [Pseudonocardia oceani]MBW0107814.1 MCE family protein [Pseudonocardia oceani]MBW0121463.1 MCE family protein [Pseudonocardia oceani]MBW0126451.1 MCE family protein [Pseudonocardia oceani]
MSATRHSQGWLPRMWAHARSEPGLFRNVVVMAALIVLGLGVGGYILSQQRFNPPWENVLIFEATFEATPAISPGNGQEVRIAGVAVGDIREARVSDEGDAVLTLAVAAEYPVYDNARVVLRPKSPLNEMYVEVSPGGPPGTPLEDGAVLPVGQSSEPIQIDEVTGYLDDNARYALTSLLSESDTALANAPATLPDGLRGADAVLTDLQPVVAELDVRRDKIARLVTALSQISSALGRDDERISRLAASLQTTLTTVAGQSQPLDDALAQLPDLDAQLRAATQGVTELAGELDPALVNLREATDVLPEALSRTNDSVERLDTTLDTLTPVIAAARPVVGDLRPVVGDLNASLDDLVPISERLEPVTAGLVPYLTDLQAFVYNTNSVVSLRDANRGILRGLLQVSPTTLPLPLQGLATPTPR